jgi:hypothetical protein
MEKSRPRAIELRLQNDRPYDDPVAGYRDNLKKLTEASGR